MIWQDLLRPITIGTRGIKKGPMVRWFSTNTFYFVPVVTAEIESRGGGFLVGALGRKGERLKVILPDPLTFADCSDDEHYLSREKLIFAYCDGILAPELAGLSKQGVGYVQFSAPSLVARARNREVPRDELRQVGEGLRSALRGTSFQTGYHTYFGDAAPCFQNMIDLIPTDDVGVDLTETDSTKLEPGAKGLIAGVADSRSSYIETGRDLIKRLGPLLDKFPSITIAPSCDLQYVPRTVADAKLEILAQTMRRLRNE
jgi:methionine synthase II (cobalamin-independent)